MERVGKAVYLAGRLVGRAATPWREQGELRLKARVARLNRLLAAVVATSGSQPGVALVLLEPRRFGGLVCEPDVGLSPRVLVDEFLGPAIAELTGGWPDKVGISLAVGIGEGPALAAERAWALVDDEDGAVGIRVGSGRPDLDRTAAALWALTEAVTSSWTGRQRKLFQIYKEHGPQVSRVAEMSGMSPSAVSHMLRRMHVHEVEEGRRAFLVMLQELLRQSNS